MSLLPNHLLATPALRAHCFLLLLLPGAWLAMSSPKVAFLAFPSLLALGLAAPVRGAPAGTTWTRLARWAPAMLLALAALGWLAAIVRARGSLAAFRPQMAQHLVLVGTTLLVMVFLRRRRWMAALVVALVGAGWQAFSPALTSYVGGLGVDALSELQGYGWSEAWFWLSTAGEIFQPVFNARTWLLFTAATAGAFFAWTVATPLVRLSRPRAETAIMVLALLVVTANVYRTVRAPLRLYAENSRSFETTRENFEPVPLAVAADAAEVDLLVYIGESTSMLHMGVYGYPRDTTPQLSRLLATDPGLVRFSSVLSTHTHTAWSLLEALSLPVGKPQDYRPINHRRRTPVVDALAGAGVATSLVSNQGMTGTWNQASPIIFGRIPRTFSVNNALLGNAEWKQTRPWDDAFLRQAAIPALEAGKARKNVVFFHSYAGHGQYLEHIPPEFRNPVDSLMTTLSKRAVLGEVNESPAEIDAYDSAVRYIDHTVGGAMQHAAGRTRPTIVLYFADHGDSVLTGRGHDSLRFVHEMARVPFLVYFNEAARKARPQLHRTYQELASSKQISTLAQLPTVLFDLLGLQLDGSGPVSLPARPGMPAPLPPIVVRETGHSVTFVHLGLEPAKPPASFNGRPYEEITEWATRSFIAESARPAGSRHEICYHAANSFGKAVRGAAVASCLESDFVVRPEGTVSIHHPPQPDTGFLFPHLAASLQGKTLWVDAKNLTDAGSCEALLGGLRQQRGKFRSALVEFPSGSHTAADKMRDCAQKMKNDGFALSYYVPTGSAVQCATALAGGAPFSSSAPCQSLQQDLTAAHATGLFTDLSFDHLGLPAMRSMPLSEHYLLNTWNITAQQLASLPLDRYRLIILNNTDLNSQ
jgi:hypothetical protein